MLAAATETELRDVEEQSLARLAAAPIGGYHDTGEPASEPIAWATLALATAGRNEAAVRGADWLAARQSESGSVGVTAAEATPGWPTALAILAWRATDAEAYGEPIRHASDWALHQKPKVAPNNRITGHDTMIEGWSWAAETHSWIEPTAFFAVALRKGQHAEHRRRHEAVRLLADRLLPSGGANYGNTVVLGQELLAHVHSSGIAMWALAGEGIEDQRLAKTLDYLRGAIKQPTGVASLAWAARGLAAHNQADTAVATQLIAAWPRAASAGGIHKPALVALAAQSVLTQRTEQLVAAP